MDLNTAHTHALGVLLDATITYNGTDIPAHIGEQHQDAQRRTVVVTVRQSDVAAPAYRDRVVINGVQWRLFKDQNRNSAPTITGDGLTWQITLYRDERPRL